MFEGNFSNSASNHDDEIQNFVPKITVMGVGGAGCNAIENMIMKGIDGVDLIVANTDAQSLMQSKCPRKIQLGKKATRGFGSGSRPEIGKAAAEESINEINEAIKNANILFLTGGMGGGTGSGAMPIIANLAREKGILTFAIITTPFDFEGDKKKKIANIATDALEKSVDAIIVLPNQNLFKVSDKQLTFMNAFNMSNNVLYEGIKDITDLIMKPGLINLDFADIHSVIKGQGRSIIGTSIQSGQNRALKAVEHALLNPLISNESILGANGVLVNITGNADNMSLEEVGEIMNTIRASINSDNTNFVFGTCFDENMGDKIKVAIIATGINSQKNARNSFENLKSDIPLGSSFTESFVKVEPEITVSNKFEVIDDIIAENISKSDTEIDININVDVKPLTDDKFDKLFNSDNTDIEKFIDDEVKNLKDATLSTYDGNNNDDDDPTPTGKKKNPLSSFFDMINDKGDDTFFDDVKSDDDIKFSAQQPIIEDNVKIETEPDNVVFLSGELDTKKGVKSQQIDLMEMIKKMEETLEIPTIFKKNN